MNQERQEKAAGPGNGGTRPTTLAPPGNAPKTRRRHPRDASEAGPVDLSAFPHLRDLEAQALADLGGEANVSALRRELLRIGLWAEGVAMMLLREIDAKAAQARKEGATPHPSRYKATAVVGSFLDLAARRYREVGLRRVPAQVPDLRDTWRGDDREGATA